MKKVFSKYLAVATLALTALAPSAYAAPVVFGYTGAIATYTVASTGVYTINAIGAQGGHGTINNGSYVGGRGASMTGSFNLTVGEIVYLAVGGMGSSVSENYNGGGGGGSFVVASGATPLLVAGGGGGIRAYANQNGCDASITSYGVSGSGYSDTSPCAVKTTDLGMGGIASYYSYGGGGAGFYGNGAADPWFGSGGGNDWVNGLLAAVGYNGSACDSTGGFGGGGSGTGCGGGGGGGGYSGGDGGHIAGGGGSWNTGFDQFAIAGVGYGNGLISIDHISASVPEPESLALVGLGLLGLCLSRRKGKQA